MRVMHRRDKSSSGLGLVEFVIVLPVAIVFVLGIVQAGFIYMAKLQVNHATFQAARMGSMHHAHEGVMRTALVRSLSPFYQNSFETNNTKRLLEAQALAWKDLTIPPLPDPLPVAPPFQMEVLNPSPLSFSAFGVKDPKTGVTYIPNDNMEWRLDGVDPKAKQRLRDANVLKLRVVYGYELKVPLIAGVLSRVMCSGNSGVDAFGNVGTLDAMYLKVSEECRRYYRRGRIPIESVAIVEMQSRAERSK